VKVRGSLISFVDGHPAPEVNVSSAAGEACYESIPDGFNFSGG